MNDKKKGTIYIALGVLIIAVVASVIIILSHHSSESSSDTVLVPYEETSETVSETETQTESESTSETTTEKQTTTKEKTTTETSTEPEVTTEEETTVKEKTPEISQLLSESKRLSKGSTGENVYVLQEILIALKYMSGQTTGTFDDATYDAVVSFQQDNNIAASGIVTSKTAKALNSKVKVNKKLTTSTKETTTEKETTTKEKETTTEKQTTTKEVVTENDNYSDYSDDYYDNSYDNYDYNYNDNNDYSDNYSSYTEPATTAHTHSYSVQSSSAATCTSQGYTTYVCSCGASYTDTTPATGHSWVAHTTSVKVIDQAATDPQYQTSYYCNGCGQQIGMFVPDTSHFSYCPAGGTSYYEQSVLISAGTSEVSHYEDQVDYYYCSVCGATK